MTYQELIDKIQSAKTAYYQTGRSELSDMEYDRLVAQAEKLGYIETVGAAPVNNIEKITHQHPMLSLDKCHSHKEIQEFCGDENCVIMWKADGLTLSATYEDGVLVRLETRGNGTVGNDIMFHAGSIENLPKVINKSGRYVIDGECVILWSDFEKINEKIPEADRYRHPRNLAAGTLNLLDNKVSKKRHLRFYAWDIIEGGCGDLLSENLNEAYGLGFDTVEWNHLWGNSPIATIAVRCGDLRMYADGEGFPIDGIVIKFDDIAYGKSLGATNHHPKFALAYKFEDERYETKLKDVVWQCGKTGILTPVAIVNPVDCGGVVVEKSTLHNVSIMKNLGLTKGCTCYIYRANDVIPQIDIAEPDGEEPIEIPEICPVCGGKTQIIRDNNSEVLVCTNPDCSGKTLGKWVHYVSKKAMDIQGLSEQTLERFLKLGYIDHMFASIYYLADYKKELYKLDGFGKKSIDNLLAAIESSKDVDLAHFICAFSIPGVGEGQSKVLAAEFRTFEAFASACDDGFYFDTIPGIGKVINQSIHQWWVNNHIQMLDVAKLVRFKTEENNSGSTLVGKTFVITGSVHIYKNRDDLKKTIESFGGKLVGSVSKNTDYLINNDVTSNSSKNVKARELGVKIISEEDFNRLIN